MVSGRAVFLAAWLLPRQGGGTPIGVDQCPGLSGLESLGWRRVVAVKY
jgi:hypothetical protein